MVACVSGLSKQACTLVYVALQKEVAHFRICAFILLYVFLCTLLSETELPNMLSDTFVGTL